MEYCGGGEFFNHIVKHKRLSENESSFFFYQIINAIEAIHKFNIAHRDLKPENILITDNNVVKLIDF
jgi:5'-AMP-activated protein kinase catalytic alpha subunit